MRLNIFRNIFNKKSIFLSLFIILFVFIYRSNTASGSTTWIIDSNYKNIYMEVHRITENEIIFRGSHNKKSNENYYKTDGYVITTSPYYSGGSFPYDANYNNVYRIYPKSELYRDDGTTITNLYKIKKEDVLRIAAQLGITGESIGNGTKAIYLQTVYDIYKGDKKVINDVVGLQEMLNAPVKYRLGYIAWNEATREKLPSYYNMQLDLTAMSTYNLEVVAVDTNGDIISDAKDKNGNSISRPIMKKKVIMNENFNYNITNTIKELQSGAINYNYVNWNYEYTDRSTGRVIKTSNWPDNNISFTLPDALPGSTLTVYIKYESKEVFNNVDIIAVTADGKEITVIDEGYKVKNQQTFEYTLSEGDKIIQGKYRYANKWYLTYLLKNSNGNTIERTLDTGRTGDKIVQVIPNALPGSTIKFKMVYEIDNSITLTPTPIVSITPTPTPGLSPTPSPTPVPEPPVPVEPLPEVVEKPIDTITATGKIEADLRNDKRFIAREGIPTTESLYGEVIATEYMLGFKFSRRVGTIYYPIEVRKNYILKWNSATPNEAGGAKQQEEVVEIKKIIMVPRVYGYWEIDHLDYYKIQSATLNNYALPGGKVILYPDSRHYSVPSISYTHSTNLNDHIIPPNEVITGITLEPQTILGDTTKPVIPNDDALFKYEAYVRTGEIKVKSDRVIFDGITVMSDQISNTIAPNINVDVMWKSPNMTNNSALYKSGQIIEATKENGDYASNGTIQYECLTYNVSSKGSSLKYGITGINNVIIHTPVVCIPMVTADNDKYVQLIEPEKDVIHLVIDSNSSLNDFTVHISNNAHHTNRLGYFTRDFSKSIIDPDNVSYIAKKDGILRNEVKFPFDVYMDIGNDGVITNDKYIKAGTWITMGRNTYRFYLPMWVEEGIYEAEFRTIAVNAVGKVSGINLDRIKREERERNVLLTNYVATNKVTFQVSGRLYGLTIYDITDYPIWEETFRMPDSNKFKKYDRDKYPDGTKKSSYSKGYSYDYALGTNDQYGNDTGRNIKYTFPLVNGSHPYYKNIGILKTGYMIRFSLETTGYMYTSGDMISITPSFYFVDKNGQNRQPVDLYYNEEFNGQYQRLVKVGSDKDRTNVKTLRAGDLNHGIPITELELTANVLKQTLNSLRWRTEQMFTFSHITITDAFRTFVGNRYANTVKSLQSYNDVKDNGITDADIIKRTQRWYGAYYLPNHVYVAPKGYDVIGYSQKYGIDYHEDFWLKDGYIIVNFKIETIDRSGKRYLSYINPTNYQENNHCSMWVLEGPPLQKTNDDGTIFKFYAGDFIIYYANKKASDDYSPGAIY